MTAKCPGSQSFSRPEPEDTKCPFCGAEVEIWSDEVKTTCPKCNKTFLREGETTCLDWCKYAKQCVGNRTYDEYMQNKMTTIKRKLIEELETHFGEDKKRINHAKKVMDFAEELLRKEKADWHIVMPASILHDVGIKETEKKYGSLAGNYQEKEGPPIARKILLKHGFQKTDIDEICDIIAHHHSPGKINSMNFKLLYDADRLVNLKDEIKKEDKIKELIDKIFLTKVGKKIAENNISNKGGKHAKPKNERGA